MASVWLVKRETASGPRFRVMYRAGGREAPARYGGSFKTRREALARKAWVVGELAAHRMPELRLADPAAQRTFQQAAGAWQAVAGRWVWWNASAGAGRASASAAVKRVTRFISRPTHRRVCRFGPATEEPLTATGRA